MDLWENWVILGLRCLNFPLPRIIIEIPNGRLGSFGLYNYSVHRCNYTVHRTVHRAQVSHSLWDWSFSSSSSCRTLFCLEDVTKTPLRPLGAMLHRSAQRRWGPFGSDGCRLVDDFCCLYLCHGMQFLWSKCESWRCYGWRSF